MFPDGRRRFSKKIWQCAWCGTPYKDGDVCPHDEEHWAQFSASMKAEGRPVLVGANSRGVA